MKVIIFIDSDDPENMEIASDDMGERLVFDSHDEAEDWCADNAESGRTYMHWDGER